MREKLKKINFLIKEYSWKAKRPFPRRNGDLLREGQENTEVFSLKIQRSSQHEIIAQKIQWYFPRKLRRSSDKRTGNGLPSKDSLSLDDQVFI